MNTSLNAGIDAGMGDMRKITVEVPEDILQSAQAFTGEGVTETVRAALKKLASMRAQQEFRKLRGTFKSTVDLDELREDRELWPQPNSSTVIAYLHGKSGIEVDQLDAALLAGTARIPPAAIVEVLGHPGLPPAHADLVNALPVLEILPGYWHRAAETRRKLLSRRLRARLADTLIAQSCIDHDEPLIANNGDFRHFAKHCGLKLA